MGLTFVQPGETLDLVAPGGGVEAGLGYTIGGLFVIALTSAAAGDQFRGRPGGVHRVPKAPSQAWTVGLQVYWDAAEERFSSVATVGPPAGVAVAAVAGGADDTEGLVLLQAFNNGAAETRQVFNVRRRFTAEEVDAAEAELIPAVVGKKIRLLSARAIAIGGAAAGVTTVDIVGVQTTPQKLVTFAQASLTQSTVLKDGGTGTVVLADGASYVANDVSTAVTIGNTGNALTGATHVDVIAEYALDT